MSNQKCALLVRMQELLCCLFHKLQTFVCANKTFQKGTHFPLSNALWYFLFWLWRSRYCDVGQWKKCFWQL